MLGTASDKYDFFMRATDLERISQDYAEVAENLGTLEDTKEKMMRRLDDLNDRVKETKRKYEQHKVLEKYEMQENEAGVKMGWAAYKESDQKYQEAVKVRIINWLQW